MSGRHAIRVEGGDPDHIELAALTAALFVLAGRRRTLHTRPAAPPHRPSWTRSRPGPPHPAHSWQVRTHRLFD
ncbi:acyl-CoA carboxylase subunit epsilon [Streptomyces sp. 12297]|uniref:acyl-CoA carboxylase subunit epsilon n=1 Tax=Streptomyces sp. NBC_00239 TaxID=2903640 RepID=UPI002E2E83D0|nr:acyl-CoA carboxylase subunit epsilon [Streptomyces sp. NBC_00239]